MHPSFKRSSAIVFVSTAVLAGAMIGAGPVVAQSGFVPETTVVNQTVPRMVVVEGQGTVEAVPDIADVVAGVLTREKTARAAVDRNNAAMQRLMAVLGSAGIAEKDIRTSRFGLSPWYQPVQRDQPREIAGYQATNQVTVTVRDLKQVGAVIDRMVTAGSNSVNGIRFGLSDPDALMDRARRKAVADAKRRAALFATEAGATLGRVLRIQESGGRMPQPRLMATAAMVESRAVPIAPGTQKIAVTVSMQYELN